MTWLTGLKNWLLAIPAVLGAIALAVLYGREKGAKEATTTTQQKADAQAADQRASTAEAAQHNVEVRHDVENEVARLPETPADHAGADPVPGSAADQLQNDWTRG